VTSNVVVKLITFTIDAKDTVGPSEPTPKSVMAWSTSGETDSTRALKMRVPPRLVSIGIASTLSVRTNTSRIIFIFSRSMMLTSNWTPERTQKLRSRTSGTSSLTSSTARWARLSRRWTEIDPKVTTVAAIPVLLNTNNATATSTRVRSTCLDPREQTLKVISAATVGDTEGCLVD